MAHITTPAGTDLYMEMNQMEPIIECGIARNPGDAMAWSDGEVSLGPVIDTTHGKLVIDGPICYYGCPTTPVELRIEKGRIVEVVGGDPKICKEIRRQIAEVKDSDNIAEIGLGLNPACMFNGDFEEEKKARGTCHIAMGNGFYYGQPARSTVHIDMVQYNPTVIFDEGTPEEVLIVKDGKVDAWAINKMATYYEISRMNCQMKDCMNCGCDFPLSSRNIKHRELVKA